ncbi:MAG TPA: hypothetical protein VF092_10680 [Longimicrobium sp.]
MEPRRRSTGARRRIFAQWGGRGPPLEGGPLARWRGWAADVRGEGVDAGHFFPEEAPRETADSLRRFFAADVPQ